MKIHLLNIYLVLTLSMIVYTSYLYIQGTFTKENDKDYVKNVHIHLTTIIYYHLCIVSFVIALKPSILLDNTMVSIVNTCLSIMFSVLFYYTDSQNITLRHIYNAFYLIFASILVAEIIVFLKLDNSLYSFIIMYLFFFLNLIMYSKDNRKKLSVILSILSVFSLVVSAFNNSIISTLCVILYTAFITAYMYYDHDKIKNTTKIDYLDDALKYFFDVEGMVIRALAGNS